MSASARRERPLVASVLLALALPSALSAQSPGRPHFAPAPARDPEAIDAASWRRVESPHFALSGDLTVATLRALAADLETLESLLAALNPDDREAAPRCEVLLFQDARTFAAYAPLADDGTPAPVSGFYLSHPHGDVIVVAASAEPDVRRVLFHESLHRFVHNHLPGAPSWLNEGLAEFYSTLEIGAGEAWVGAPVAEHLARLARDARHPLAALVATETDVHPYRGGDSAFYAQSWALVHYLLTGDEDGRSALTELAGRLRDGQDPGEAFAAAFVDLGALERGLEAHLDGPASRPARVALPRTAARSEAAAVPLPVADLHFRLGWLLSHHAPPRIAPARVHFEAALRHSPDHPGALTGLGWLEEIQGDHDSARQHYARAAELAPGDPVPHLLAGLSQLRRAGLLQASERADERDSGAAARALELARRSFRRSLELEPGRAEAWAGLGASWVSDPAPASEGLEALREAHRRLPGRDDVLYNLTVLEARIGSHQRAAALYAALERRADPPLVEGAREALLRADLLRAERLLERGRRDEAVVLLERVLATTGDRALAATVAGRLQALDGG